MRHTFGALLLGVSFAAAVSYLAAGLHRAYRSRHPHPWLAHFHALTNPDRCSCGGPWPCLDTVPEDRGRGHR